MRLKCISRIISTKYKKLFIALALFSSFLVWEEVNVGKAVNFYGNYYDQRLYLQITKNRTSSVSEQCAQINIGVIVVVNRTEDLHREYQLAQKTLQCYCWIHNYPLIVVDFSVNESLRQLCPHGDFMFRRHCAIAHILTQTTLDYLLFVDGDMGVINPNHLLEEYIISDDVDFTFYERIFNYEIMAGSLIVRRSNYSIEFLHYWADYFYKLPNSFHGWDNAAIHKVFADKFCTNCSRQRMEICDHLWNSSRDWDSLSLFTSCIRSVLGDRNVFLDANNGGGKVSLLTNFQKGYWARDGWLTGNLWSPQDFLLHGWQKRHQDSPVFARWHSPIIEGEDWSECIWPYKNSFVANNELVKDVLSAAALQGRLQHLENLKLINELVFFVLNRSEFIIKTTL